MPYRQPAGVVTAAVASLIDPDAVVASGVALSVTPDDDVTSGVASMEECGECDEAQMILIMMTTSMMDNMMTVRTVMTIIHIIPGGQALENKVPSSNIKMHLSAPWCQTGGGGGL